MTNTLAKIVRDVDSAWEQAMALDLSGSNPNRDNVLQAFDALHIKDQAYRTVYVSHLKAGNHEAIAQLRPLIRKADSENRAWLRHWLQTQGWPLRSIYGDVPPKTAWLVALHSDSDIPFQQQVFGTLEPLFESKQVTAIKYAALSDRIAINEGRPQHWGMFYQLEDGKQVAYPVEDPANLQTRRAQLALGDAKFHR